MCMGVVRSLCAADTLRAIYVCFPRNPGVWSHALSPLVRIETKTVDVIESDLSYLGLCDL